MARILIVEDNPANMELAVFLLDKAGHEVMRATDAETGIRLAREQLPELILMDIQLPGMDGLTAARRLKDDDETQGARIIALTAFAMKGDKERLRAAGFDGYIAKPFHHRELTERIHQHSVEHPRPAHRPCARGGDAGRLSARKLRKPQ